MKSAVAAHSSDVSPEIDEISGNYESPLHALADWRLVEQIPLDATVAVDLILPEGPTLDHPWQRTIIFIA